jgi:hypothetical protein
MHGRQWHDHEHAKDFEPEVMAGAGAGTDVESGGERMGIGRMHKESPTAKGHVRRKRTTPPTKGPKRNPRR